MQLQHSTTKTDKTTKKKSKMNTNVHHKQKAAAKVDDANLEEPSPPVLIDKKRSSDHVEKKSASKKLSKENMTLINRRSKDKDLGQQQELFPKMAPNSVARLAVGKETKLGFLENNETVPSSSSKGTAHNDEEMYGLKPVLEAFPEALNAFKDKRITQSSSEGGSVGYSALSGTRLAELNVLAAAFATESGKAKVAHDVATKNKGGKKDKEPSKKASAPHASFDGITKEGPQTFPETENDRFGTLKGNEMTLKVPHSFVERQINYNDKMTREGPEVVAATEPKFNTNPKKNVPKMAKDINMENKQPRSACFTTHDDRKLSKATEEKKENIKGQKQDGPSLLFSTEDDISVDWPVPICNDTACENKNSIAKRNRRSRERRKMRLQNEQGLYDEGLPSSISPGTGRSENTKSALRPHLPSESDETTVEEEEQSFSHAGNDERQEPGAFAIAGIGVGNPSNIWESTGTLGMFDNRETSIVPSNHQHNTSESENLISAIVVDDGPIQEAEAVSEEVLKRIKRRRTLCCLVSLALVIVTIVLAIVLTRDTSTVNISQSPSQSQLPSTSPSVSPSLSPTSVPSVSPSMSPTTSIRSFLEDVSPQLNETFDNDTSPQFKALRWLESNHTDLFNTYTEDRIIQRFVLAILYYSTQGEQWIQSNDWLNPTQHECGWYQTNRNYERCSHDKKYFSTLKLTSNRLKGTLPREMYLFSNLLVLDLSDNVLRGTLPSELGLLKNIKTINLNGNSLDGSLPTALSDLKTSLTQLDLSSNTFVGKIPSILSLLTGLESLKINDNVLSGAIFSEIGMLSNLKLLSLMGNNLDGIIPSQVACMQRLEILNLNYNLFSGAIPLTTNQTSTESFVPILPKLKELCVRSNFITSTLPSQIGLISALEVLDMRSNRLQSIIPSEIGQLVRLDKLDLSENFDIIGVIPTELGLIIQLESLELYSNNLNGTIPETIRTLVNLESLDLSYNILSGTIPETIGSLGNMKSLYISENHLSGTIPETMASLVNLESLDLSNNDLNGTIPETIGSLVNLKLLHLSSNSLSGTIPEAIKSLVNLVSLVLVHNGLSGTIPETIGSLVNLEYLNLRANSLNGSIPKTIRSLVHLESLDLSHNYLLSGIIPENIGSLVNLKSLDLSFNSLNGTMPETIGSLVNLVLLFLSRTSLNGTIPATIGSLVNLELLHLKQNSFTGPLPTELGELENLDALWIQNNDITGEVPNEICKLRRTNNFREFDLDCKKIACDCCFDWCPNPPRILNSTLSTPNCTDGMTLLQVAIGTDNNPEGVEWDVVDESMNETLLQVGQLTQDDRWKTILKETCVSNDACLVFKVHGSNDHGSDWWLDAGDRFMVHLNGSEISNGRFQDFQEAGGRIFLDGNSTCVSSDRIQACSVTHPTCGSIGLECNLDNHGGISGFCNSPAPSLAPSTSQAPSLSPSQSQSSSPSISVWPSLSPAPSFSPSSNPSYTFAPCDNGLSAFVIELNTDNHPLETSWKLVDDDTGDLILQGDDYTDEYTTFVSQTCISNESCLRFTIYDSIGDGLSSSDGGYVIYVNDEEVASGGGEFKSSETKLIGSCLDTSFPSVSPSLTTPTVIVDSNRNRNDNDDEHLLPCQDSMVNFTVEIAIENDPERIAWTLVNRHSGSTPSGDGSNDDSILLQGGPYKQNDVVNVNDGGTISTTTAATTFVQSACVVSDACLVFEIQDAEEAATSIENNELSCESDDVQSVLATVHLYANGIRIAVAIFDGPTTIKEVGACSPIQ